MTILDSQAVDAARHRPGLTTERLSDGLWVVAFASQLPGGWNSESTLVRFVLPLPYPAAQPDCFYAASDLRLADGAMPANSGIQQLDGVPLLWFSWHLAAWNPQQDDLFTYVRFIESRLHDAR
jgi:hypothetical protein